MTVVYHFPHSSVLHASVHVWVVTAVHVLCCAVLCCAVASCIVVISAAIMCSKALEKKFSYPTWPDL